MPALAGRGVDSYLRTAAESATPAELVVMLYDGAIRFTASARDAIVRGDIQARGAAISRVLAIVGHLQSTLDLDRGGEVAASLDRLYSFVTGRLLDAAFKQDVGPLDEASQILSTLRGAWADIASSQAPTNP